jgi:hypothetical protein
MALAVIGAGKVAVPKGGPPPPPGCHWQSIAAIKAQLAVPEGWRFFDTSTRQGRSYEVWPAGPGFENAKARYRLEISEGNDPAGVAAKAKAFVEATLKLGAKADPIQEQQVRVFALYSSSVTMKPERAGAVADTIAVSAAANTRTGTLYTVRFLIPASEVEKTAVLGNRLFQKIRLDDGF